MEVPRPRYQQIADDLREAIREGTYEAGRMLPSHPKIADDYGVSRTLAKQATDVLVAEGLVRSEQGRGIVVLTTSTAKFVHMAKCDDHTSALGDAFADDIRRAGQVPRARLSRSGVITPSGRIAERLGLGTGEQVRAWEWVTLADDDVPIHITTSYVPTVYTGSSAAMWLDSGPSGIYERLAERGYRLAVFTEDIEVRGATKDEARFLGIPIGEPIFEILFTATGIEGHTMVACSNVLASKQWQLTYRWRQEP
jgi:GntR family transcriptional regulator